MPTSPTSIPQGPTRPRAWRLALVTLLQFREDLSDRRAADAVLRPHRLEVPVGLELTDPGFDDCVLSGFRCRLVAGGGEGLVLETRPSSNFGRWHETFKQ